MITHINSAGIRLLVGTGRVLVQTNVRVICVAASAIDARTICLLPRIYTAEIVVHDKFRVVSGIAFTRVVILDARVGNYWNRSIPVIQIVTVVPQNRAGNNRFVSFVIIITVDSTMIVVAVVINYRTIAYSGIGIGQVNSTAVIGCGVVSD